MYQALPQHIGFVCQAYHLIDEMTVGSSERASRIADLLDRFNIVAKKDLFPNQLSSEQQQLVSITRALAAFAHRRWCSKRGCGCIKLDPYYYLNNS